MSNAILPEDRQASYGSKRSSEDLKALVADGRRPPASRALLHQMGARDASLTVIGFKTNCAKGPQFTMYRPGSALLAGARRDYGERFSTKFHNLAL